MFWKEAGELIKLQDKCWSHQSQVVLEEQGLMPRPPHYPLRLLSSSSHYLTISSNLSLVVDSYHKKGV